LCSGKRLAKNAGQALARGLEFSRQGSTPEQDRACRNNNAGENAPSGQDFAKEQPADQNGEHNACFP
jgi:hypothetical protein